MNNKLLLVKNKIAKMYTHFSDFFYTEKTKIIS